MPSAVRHCLSSLTTFAAAPRWRRLARLVDRADDQRVDRRVLVAEPAPTATEPGGDEHVLADRRCRARRTRSCGAPLFDLDLEERPAGELVDPPASPRRIPSPSLSAWLLLLDLDPRARALSRASGVSTARAATSTSRLRPSRPPRRVRSVTAPRSIRSRPASAGAVPPGWSAPAGAGSPSRSVRRGEQPRRSVEVGIAAAAAARTPSQLVAGRRAEPARWSAARDSRRRPHGRLGPAARRVTAVTRPCGVGSARVCRSRTSGQRPRPAAPAGCRARRSLVATAHTASSRQPRRRRPRAHVGLLAREVDAAGGADHAVVDDLDVARPSPPRWWRGWRRTRAASRARTATRPGSTIEPILLRLIRNACWWSTRVTIARTRGSAGFMASVARRAERVEHRRARRPSRPRWSASGSRGSRTAARRRGCPACTSAFLSATSVSGSMSSPGATSITCAAMFGARQPAADPACPGSTSSAAAAGR